MCKLQSVLCSAAAWLGLLGICFRNPLLSLPAAAAACCCSCPAAHTRRQPAAGKLSEAHHIGREHASVLVGQAHRDQAQHNLV